MTISDLHLECRQEEAALHKRIAELERQLSTLRDLMDEALSNMEYYPASLGEYWLVQESDITAISAALKEQDNG